MSKEILSDFFSVDISLTDVDDDSFLDDLEDLFDYDSSADSNSVVNSKRKRQERVQVESTAIWSEHDVNELISSSTDPVGKVIHLLLRK